MTIKYYPPEGSLLARDGFHLFEGEESSYWAVFKEPCFIYRLNKKQHQFLSLKEINLSMIDVRFVTEISENELNYINEYKKALEAYKKYSYLV